MWEEKSLELCCERERDGKSFGEEKEKGEGEGIVRLLDAWRL